MNRYKSVLTIAGSDSGGGAGIQADIKSISANGAYAATVITASTAQNTMGVTDIHGLPLAHIEAQLEAVFSDIAFGAVKIGMLYSAEVIELVSSMLKSYDAQNIVLDPVMISTSGRRLLSRDAIESLKAFLPHTSLITPNIPEAQLLLGERIDLANMESSVKAIAKKFSVSVLLKGGHLESSERMTDMLYLKAQKRVVVIHNPTVPTNNTHGTGCSLSSAIATHLALGRDLEEAVVKSCRYVNQALEAGKDKILGQGSGPVNHFML